MATDGIYITTSEYDEFIWISRNTTDFIEKTLAEKFDLSDYELDFAEHSLLVQVGLHYDGDEYPHAYGRKHENSGLFQKLVILIEEFLSSKSNIPPSYDLSRFSGFVLNSNFRMPGGEQKDNWEFFYNQRDVLKPEHKLYFELARIYQFFRKYLPADARPENYVFKALA